MAFFFARSKYGRNSAHVYVSLKYVAQGTWLPVYQTCHTSIPVCYVRNLSCVFQSRVELFLNKAIYQTDVDDLTLSGVIHVTMVSSVSWSSDM